MENSASAGKTEPTPKALARQICSKLNAEGFTVHRLDWPETGSVYLAVDYGVCGRIRISGHANRRHRACKFNIGSWLDKRGTDRDYALHYYPVRCLDNMIADIAADREKRIDLYGIAGYAHAVDEKKRQAKWEIRKGTGFFAHARLMKGGKK